MTRGGARPRWRVCVEIGELHKATAKARRDASDSSSLEREPGSCRAPAKRGRRTQASDRGRRWGPRPQGPLPSPTRAIPYPLGRPHADGSVLDGCGRVHARPGWASWSRTAETC